MAAALILAGCAQQVVLPDAAQRQAAAQATRTGTASLACGNATGCVGRWRSVHEAVLQDAAGQQWDDLAALVIAAGYDADISWYYLAQAAQGMGSYDAARLYFQSSIRHSVAGGASTCAGGTVVDLCNGVSLPTDAQLLLSQVPVEEPPPPPPPVRKRRAARRAAPQNTAQPAPASGSSGSGFVPPVASPAPAAGSPPTGSPPTGSPAAGGAAGGFVAPVQPSPAPSQNFVVPVVPQSPPPSPQFVAPVQ